MWCGVVFLAERSWWFLNELLVAFYMCDGNDREDKRAYLV